MKFIILKLIISSIFFCMCINFIFSSQTQTKTLAALTTKSHSAIGMNSNYKMALGSLFAKSYKKFHFDENNNGSSSNYMNEQNVLENNFNHKTNVGQIYFKGWIKYFKYIDKKASQKPKEFFKNIHYEKQQKRKKGKSGIKKEVTY